MPDYGHPLEFGYFLLPDSADPAATLATARLLDELGYDFIGVQDHLLPSNRLRGQGEIAYRYATW